MLHDAKKIKRAGAIAALLWPLSLSSCLTSYLEEDLKKQREQLDQQNLELARQRQELEALAAGKQIQDRKQQECNRAFREYFDRAQLATDREQAISLYRRGLEICPDDDVAHYELGRALADARRFGEAEKSFEAALKINPDFTEARRQLEAIRKTR